MELIQKNDTGAAVEDIQGKLAELGFLQASQITGVFDGVTEEALLEFCRTNHLPESRQVDDRLWAQLLDATFRLGDRTLYLRMPYFHGNDVLLLQQALGALGFSCGASDGIFGAHTEDALRKFQMNMGLPTDGIVGAATYRAINNLQHSWEGKTGPQTAMHLGFARAADVLESNALCLFGTDSFTRSVATRMSNLSLATNPASRIISADSLLVAPDDEMLLVHVVLSEDQALEGVPFVSYEDENTLSLRLKTAIGAASATPPRISICLPGAQWEDAGESRSAQHFAITLLDALCIALA